MVTLNKQAWDCFINEDGKKKTTLKYAPRKRDINNSTASVIVAIYLSIYLSICGWVHIRIFVFICYAFSLLNKDSWKRSSTGADTLLTEKVYAGLAGPATMTLEQGLRSSTSSWSTAVFIVLSLFLQRNRNSSSTPWRGCLHFTLRKYLLLVFSWHSSPEIASLLFFRGSPGIRAGLMKFTLQLMNCWKSMTHLHMAFGPGEHMTSS